MIPIPSRHLGFASCIKLTTKDEFEALVQERWKNSQAKEHYAIETSNTANWVRLKDWGLTELAGDCNVLGVHNHQGNPVKEHQLTLTHLFSRNALEARVLRRIRSALKHDIAELKKQCIPVRSLVTAGWAYLDNWRGKYSIQLFGELLNILKEAGVQDISIIWGRTSKPNSGSTSVLYDASVDTWFIHAIRNVHVSNNKIQFDNVLTWKDLQETFRIIKIAKGDTLITKDKVIEGDASPIEFVDSYLRQVLG
jgi:hypothetical protein